MCVARCGANGAMSTLGGAGAEGSLTEQTQNTLHLLQRCVGVECVGTNVGQLNINACRQAESTSQFFFSFTLAGNKGKCMSR